MGFRGSRCESSASLKQSLSHAPSLYGAHKKNAVARGGRSMKRSHTLFSISLLALVVSGCAVTSQPIDRSVSEQRAKSDLQLMYRDQEPLNGALTLHCAMARAVKYNLEARLKIMEEAPPSASWTSPASTCCRAWHSPPAMQGAATSARRAAKVSRPEPSPSNLRLRKTAAAGSLT